MDILVRKYGGTSLADEARLRAAATSVAEAARDRRTVVVVSARGATTDQLLALAADLGAGPSDPTTAREVDQLLATGEQVSAALFAITLCGLGVPAVSLTGAQAGIRVTGPAGAGRIAAIDPSSVLARLDEDKVVVVAGFQGVDDAGEVITLGRGGSDTTAVAIAVALGAPQCEIYTDVDGVFTADPRVVPTATALPEVGMDPMVELAFAGAKVLHSRSVELSSVHGVELTVRSALRDTPGTVVAPAGDEAALESHALLAIAHDVNVTRVLIRADAPAASTDLAVAVLSVFARHHAAVDLVARSGAYETEFRMGFTARRDELPPLLPELKALVADAGGSVVLDEDVAKVSLLGTGLLNRPQFTAAMLAALADAGIATSWISTTQLRVSVVVAADRVAEAVGLLHKEFDLDQLVHTGQA